jgi:TonB family protein
MLVWGAGTVFSLAVFSKRRLALKSALRRGNLLISGRAVDALHRMQNQLKQQRPLTLLVSSDFSEPGVCGTWKPTLVLPRGMVEALTEDELEAVMLHELVHVQRRDNLASTFQSWLCGVFWFYPVVWLIDRQLLVERELACDEEVLATTRDSQNYLSSLIKVFRLSLRGTMAGVSLATGSNLKRRIDHMRSHHSRKNLVVLHRLMITGFALALTVSIVGAALLNQGLLVAHENSEPSKDTNFSRSVSAPRGVAPAAPGIGLRNISSGTSGNLSGEARFVVSTNISGNVNQAAQAPVHVAAHRTPTGQAQQAGSAKLAGTVYDASKAAVPDATVVVSSTESKTQEITISGAAGEYEFRVLPVGRYSIEARKSGFQVFKQQTLLTANESGRLDIVLDVGEVSERVEVVAKAPPAASPNTGPSPPRRIRVGGNVQATKLVHQANPVYPERARAQGVQGIVLLEAVISKEGTIRAIRVVNKLADPELVDAAVEAVKNWRYEPTLLNGQPIEVVTTITVNFRLSSS